MNERKPGPCAVAGPPFKTANRIANAGGKDRYISVLQVVGTVAVIAFHVGARGSGAGWTAVVLFFALAGFNMAGAGRRSDTIREYGYSRFQRMIFPLAIAWGLVLVTALFGTGT